MFRNDPQRLPHNALPFRGSQPFHDAPFSGTIVMIDRELRGEQ
jgi:hypothetical protein